MPNKHFYFALGAAHGVVITYAVRKARHWLSKRVRLMRRLYHFDRDWFLYFPFFIGLMGMVALIPDILHGLHLLPKEATRAEFFNIFFFHSYFEWLEDANPDANWMMNTVASLFLLVLSMGVFIFYIRVAHKIIEQGEKSKTNDG